MHAEILRLLVIFEDSSKRDVDQLKTLLNDHDLVQFVDMPTHKRGHVLDWVIVRHDASCLSLETVEDIALLHGNGWLHHAT